MTEPLSKHVSGLFEGDETKEKWYEATNKHALVLLQYSHNHCALRLDWSFQLVNEKQLAQENGIWLCLIHGERFNQLCHFAGGKKKIQSLCVAGKRELQSH